MENEVKEKIKEVEERLEKRVEGMAKAGGDRLPKASKRRCVIITDSNGAGATGDSIRNHIPRAERDNYDIKVIAAYTTEEATRRVGRGDIVVRGATVVVDVLTNDVRTTRNRKAASPEELVCRVDRLRGTLCAAGASSVVTCQIKPMQATDVTPFNALLNDYLPSQGKSGHGCRTQIRLSYLKQDGFHVEPQYDSTIDRTYACAIMGVPVPCPTPINEFIPNHMRRRWEMDWPRVGRGQVRNNGW